VVAHHDYGRNFPAPETQKAIQKQYKLHVSLLSTEWVSGG
jgi:hypothetical protein